VCQQGACVAESSLVVASGSNPEDLVVDNGAIYFTNLGDDSVRGVSLSGGQVTTLATGQARPMRIAADGTFVYWSSNLGGAVLRTREDGTGSPTVLASASNPWGIAVDSSWVYWMDTGTLSVQRAPKGGGSPVTLWSYSGGGQGWSQDELAIINGKPPQTVDPVLGTSYGGGEQYAANATTFFYGGGKTVAWWEEAKIPDPLAVSALPAANGQAYGMDQRSADQCGAYGSWPSAITMVPHPQTAWDGNVVPVVSPLSRTPNRVAVGDGYLV
jgi:hypothetical protein